MSQITKTVTLSGASATSIEDAIGTVLGRAAETIADIQRFAVVSIDGSVDSAGVAAEYHVTLEITFTVKDSTTHD